jgi:hypothetical protein
MGNAIIRKGNVALYTDLINANISGASGKIVNITGPRDNLNATLSANAQSQAVSTLWTIAPSYTVYRAKTVTVDLLAGGRFLDLSTNAGFQLTGPLGDTHTVGVSQAEHVGDFIVGTYGHVALGPRWSVPFYLDGGFGSPSTWQGIIGLKYGNGILAWRYLRYSASSNEALMQSMSLNGPLLGYTLHF